MSDIKITVWSWSWVCRLIGHTRRLYLCQYPVNEHCLHCRRCDFHTERPSVQQIATAEDCRHEDPVFESDDFKDTIS